MPLVARALATWLLAFAIAIILPVTLLGQAAARADSSGSLEVSTVATECVPSIELRLWEVRTSASGATGRTGRAPVGSTDCRWRIEGLTPGTYQIDLLTPAGSAGSSDNFVVREHEIARIVIAPASARVEGRVLVAGKPVASASVDFIPRGGRWGTIETETDAGGRYAVTLARAGTYELLLQGTSAPTASRSVDIVAGANTIDWAISAPGRITVRVRGLHANLPASVHVESRRTSHSGDIPSGAEPALTKEGLEFDDYSVSAVQDTLVSAIENVRLDASNPAIDLELEVAENRAQLIVSDFKGNPVRDVRVRAVVPAQNFVRGGQPLQPSQIGIYPLNGLRPGTNLLVRAAGLAAACVTVPRNQTVYATLESGRRVEVEMPRDLTPAVVRELAALTDVPGSDCPVPLIEFQPVPKNVGPPGQPVTYEFGNFPSASRLGLLRFGVPFRRVLVPDHGEVVIERE